MFDRPILRSWPALAVLLALAVVPRLGRSQEAPAPDSAAPAQAPAAEQAQPTPEDRVQPKPIPDPELGPVLQTTPIASSDLGANMQVVDSTPLVRDRNNIWTLNFAFKPVRIQTVEIPGKGRRPVHYLYYRVINKTGKPRMFVPQFILVTNTGKRYDDTVLPNAVRVIQAREHPSRPLLGAVDIVGILPPSGSKQGVEDAVFGVALWEGVDPAADAFSVFVQGLSEGVMVEPAAQEAYERDVRRKLAIQLKKPDDPEAKAALEDTIASDKDLSIKELTEPPAKDSDVVVKHKTLIIDFVRPGDERDPREREIRLVDPSYTWDYIHNPLQWYQANRSRQWLLKQVNPQAVSDSAGEAR